MNWFRREDPLHNLSNALDHLRTDLNALRSLVRDQSEEITTLRNERALRETELADLRTRYETLIKRITGRVDRMQQPEGNSETPLEHRRRIRGF